MLALLLKLVQSILAIGSANQQALAALTTEVAALKLTVTQVQADTQTMLKLLEPPAVTGIEATFSQPTNPVSVP